MNEPAFKELIDQYITGNLSAEDRTRFALLLEDPQYRAMLEAELERSFLADAFEGAETAERKARLNKLIFERTISKPEAIVHRVHFLRRNWLRIAAAAVVLLSLGTVLYYTWRKPVQQETAATTIKPVATDIAPGGNRAKLMLSDGSVVMLDSMANGILAQQGNTNVVKLNNGQLVYTEESKKNGKPFTTEHSPLTYNMLTTPRGGQYQLVLPDGTKVWLNAASSIRYPAAFTGRERRVQITGEAYFEVAAMRLGPGRGAGQKKPFIVEANGTNVAVLGTHFNVNAYTYENSQRVTLLEGAVLVTKDQHWTRIRPGQQAQVRNEITVSDHVDLEAVVAWKNGKFNFGEAADIHSVMNQIADWYDVQIVFERNTDKHISGTISRNVNLSLLLQMLKATGVVDFKVEGKTIKVIPVP